MDPENGDLLASVNMPSPDILQEKLALGEASGSLLDRARYGLYPPGSTFKVVTAIAALRLNPALANQQYQCIRLPDGRTGAYVGNSKRPIRDDEEDKSPHGTLDMHRAIVVSCNAYFAQLGTYKVGAQQSLDTAKMIGISVANPPTVKNLTPQMPQVSYGQGQVVVTPFQMARVASAIAAFGSLPEGRWVTDDGNTPQSIRAAIDARRYGGFTVQRHARSRHQRHWKQACRHQTSNRGQDRYRRTSHRAIARMVYRIRALRRRLEAHRLRHPRGKWPLWGNCGRADGGRSRGGGPAVTFNPMNLLRRIEKSLDHRLRSIFLRGRRDEPGAREAIDFIVTPSIRSLPRATVGQTGRSRFPFNLITIELNAADAERKAVLETLFDPGNSATTSVPLSKITHHAACRPDGLGASRGCLRRDAHPLRGAGNRRRPGFPSSSFCPHERRRGWSPSRASRPRRNSR